MPAQTVPQVLLDQVKKIQQIKDTSKDDYLNTIIPLLLDDAQEQCNQTFKIDALPSGIVLYLAKACEFNLGDTRLKSRSMGNVSYSFNTELPASVTKLLRPYKRVRFITNDQCR